MVAKRGSKKKSERPTEESHAANQDGAVDQEENLDPVQATEEVVPADMDEEFEASQQAPIPGAKEIRVRPSDSLYKKLCEQAGEEGLSVEEYCAELLAEGAVIRAWEIVEKKLTMRGGGNNPQQRQHQHNHNNRHGNHGNRGNQKGGGGGGGGNNNRRMSHTRYQSIMDDKANFLEYVRNQERKNR